MFKDRLFDTFFFQLKVYGNYIICKTLQVFVICMYSISTLCIQWGSVINLSRINLIIIDDDITLFSNTKISYHKAILYCYQHNCIVCLCNIKHRCIYMVNKLNKLHESMFHGPDVQSESSCIYMSPGPLTCHHGVGTTNQHIGHSMSFTNDCSRLKHIN